MDLENKSIQGRWKVQKKVVVTTLCGGCNLPPLIGKGLTCLPKCCGDDPCSTSSVSYLKDLSSAVPDIVIHADVSLTKEWTLPAEGEEGTIEISCKFLCYRIRNLFSKSSII